MNVVYGDFWEWDAQARVITTNGYVNRRGEAVMGRGVAYQARERLHFNIARVLGEAIERGGNHVYALSEGYFSFPVKHHWSDRADLALIERSAGELVIMMQYPSMRRAYPTIVLPRPGCGNGGLLWEKVEPVIAPILDDRFYVIDYAPDD